MAIAAGLVGVRADGGMHALRLVVTLHAVARPGRAIAKRVAVLAGRRARGGQVGRRVERRPDRAVASDAIFRRCRERVAVAVAARELADVGLVSRRFANIRPHGGHLFGDAAVVRARAPDQRQHHERLHRVPAGWHIRHGIAVSGCRLEKPGGCGLPPTPPTA